LQHLLLLATLLLFSATAFASPNDKARDEQTRAVEFLKEGLQNYEAARYEEARESFRQGYELDPKPEFLFAMGQTERLSGDCSSALVFYGRFLDSKPANLHVELVNQMMEKCVIALGSSPIAKEESKEPVAAPVVSVKPIHTSPAIDYRPWHREPIGLTLLSTGVVSVIAGGTFMAMAKSTSTASAQTYQKHEVALEKAKRQQVIGVVGVAAGSALLTSAALYYLFRDKPSHVKAVSISAAEDQLSASVQVSF
jgi:tetratricopeptide (TPR) repeat protein